MAAQKQAVRMQADNALANPLKALSELKSKCAKTLANTDVTAAARVKLFKQRVQSIVDFNEGDASFMQGINCFSAMTDAELSSVIMKDLTVPTREPGTYDVFVAEEGSGGRKLLTNPLPTTFDWRNITGVVSPVENQGSCGCCFAFSAAAALEGQLKIKRGIDGDVSEQQGLDCRGGAALTNSYNGCNGGWPDEVWTHQRAYGAVLNTAWTYAARDTGTCTPQTRTKAMSAGTSGGWGSSAYTFVLDAWYAAATVNRVDLIKTALMTHGPLAATVSTMPTLTNKWQTYKTGLYACNNARTTMPDHSVTIVGWDQNSDGEFWIIKNSWGVGWGEGGYMRLRTATSGSLHDCGLARWSVSYPNVVRV